MTSSDLNSTRISMPKTEGLTCLTDTPERQQGVLAKLEVPIQVVPIEPKKTDCNERPTGAVLADSINSLGALLKTRTTWAQHAWESFRADQLPPLVGYGRQRKVFQLSEAEWGDARNWFVLGDLHGDFYALRNCVKHIITQCPDFRLIFVGDLVDRGMHAMECLWFLLALALDYPNRVLWLAGNHDVGVIRNADGSFCSKVSPSEFIDDLNRTDSFAWFRRQFGNEYIELVEGLPRAVLSPDGTLFTHGGMPHVDRQQEAAVIANDEAGITWLNSDPCLEDFTWTRINRRPRKLPNRNSLGCSYGYSDFATFASTTKEFFPVARLVTGHEHPAGGVDEHPEWTTHPALTLKGYGFDNQYEQVEAYGPRYQQELVVGRCRISQIPEVIKIQVDKDDLNHYYNNEIVPEFKRRYGW